MWTIGGMQVETRSSLTSARTRDQLTGLLDRDFFMKALTRFAADAANSSRGAVMLVGLDHFRMWNITQGHAAADRILRAVADRLAAKIGMLEKSALVSRIGSDEFGIIVPELTKEAARPLAERLLELVREPIYLEQMEIRVAASLGLSLAYGPGQTAETIWRNTEMALDQAKKDGGNKFRVSAQDCEGRLERRLLLQNRLGHAIEKRELKLHYQPQVDLTDQRTSGLECLLRWNNPELGSVSPIEFIPIAEETGLISSIGDWVLYEACRQCKQWQTEGQLQLPVSVNVSSRQFQDSLLPNRIQSILDEMALSPAFLELELTESMTLPSQALESLQGLKRIGIRIAIDDFGTGYSSLSYLQKLPIDILKIDQSFIKELHSSPVNASIVKTIVTLARQLDLRIVAEGVERLDVARLLQQFQCHSAQGYYYSPPMEAAPIPALVRMLDKHAKK